MIGVRQLVRPRLRYAAPKLQLTVKSPSFPRSSRTLTTIVHRPLSSQWLWLRRFVYFGIFSFLGASYAYTVYLAKMAPPFEVGSEDDESLMELIRQKFDERPLVKQLREDSDYVEAPVYGNYSWWEKLQRLTSGPMSGSGGLGEQRVFTNSKEKTVVNVLWLGRGLEGFPFCIHGGAIATILDETLARVAFQHLPERTGVTANLDINYREVTLSDEFYSIHATLDQERSTERKAYVKGVLQDPHGKVCAEATGLFVVPRGYKLQKLGDDY